MFLIYVKKCWKILPEGNSNTKREVKIMIYYTYKHATLLNKDTEILQVKGS